MAAWHLSAACLVAFVCSLQAAENSLGIEILPAPPYGRDAASAGSSVQFAAWPTRVRDFERFVQATGYNATAGALSLGRDGWKLRGDSWRHPGFKQGPDHPVICVSYFDALAFCRWLTDTERAAGRLDAQHCYRLPTDDEWQQLIDWVYGGAKFPWTQTSTDLRAPKDWPPVWYQGNYAGEKVLESGFWPDGWDCAKGYRDDFAGTAPVSWGGSERWGYHDLSGNVRQWTGTTYRRELNRAELRAAHPVLEKETSDAGSPMKVVRGSSWNDYLPGLLELGTRTAREPRDRDSGLGFRIVLAPGDVPKD